MDVSRLIMALNSERGRFGPSAEIFHLYTGSDLISESISFTSNNNGGRKRRVFSRRCTKEAPFTEGAIEANKTQTIFFSGVASAALLPRV